MKEGLWLRLVEVEGEQYLILEQLISNKSDRRVESDGSMHHTIGGVMPEGKAFASLKSQVAPGVYLSNYSSTSKGVQPEGAELFDPGFSYSIKKYRVSFDDDFKGKYLLTKYDFEGLPKKCDIGKVVLVNLDRS